MAPIEVNKFVVSFRNLIQKIYNLNVPVITAIDGVALGKKTLKTPCFFIHIYFDRRWFRNCPCC